MPRVSVRRAILCLLPLLGVLAIFALWPAPKEVIAPQTEPPTQQQAFVLLPTVDQQNPIPKEVTYPKEWPWYMKGKGRPWYMTGGSDGTSPERTKLFPGENPASDRIEEQLLYAPETKKTKLILVYNGFRTWSNIKAGASAFSSCPVKDCMLTANKGEALKADAILFNEHFSNPGINRPRGQVWILYMLECPYHTQHIKQNDVFNWTATYRRDSDIVTPYEKWVYYDKDKTFSSVRRNYALNKTKKVAWFVSNCGARNSRLQYAHELQKHIEVDIYGACGSKKCPRSKQEKCFDMLNTDYKFYLAFENSNCQDYITEKFFVNGLGSNVIPIVMGARQEEYARSAPVRSFIHVDEFDSPKSLADYLHTLDKDDDLYNTYFRWKGTGEFINTHFFCRMCALLHDRFPAKSYRDINAWWRGPGVCTTTSWKKQKSKWSKQEKCFDMLNTDYKFYLAFENSNCQDYITEKFFVNGLGSNVIPIVMGARQEEYARSAPVRSFIHVDEFDSPKSLADYLHTLDKDDDLYNTYFRWKGTGEFINTHFFCRMCALLHDRFPAKSYRDINAWWRGPGVCTTTSWKKQKSKWYTSLTQRLS